MRTGRHNRRRGLLTAAVLQTNYSTANAVQQQATLEETEQKPNEIKFRTGIPTLTAFETGHSDLSDYYSVKQEQYPYLDRAIQKGTTLISNAEMDEYFKTFSDKGYKFAVSSNDGTIRYFAINYFEPPISLDRHNILVSIKDNLDESAKSLSSNDEAYLSEAISRPFRWVQIGDSEASALNNRIGADGNVFNVNTGEGTKTVRLMYLGPYSTELQLPEFKAMYEQTATNPAGGQ
jgi:hypothetical protein